MNHKFLHRCYRIFSAAAALALATLPFSAHAETAATGGWTMSPFGVGACNQTSQELEKWIPQMSGIGLHVMRTARTSWGDVEPEEGKWTWEVLDKQMAYLSSQHFEFGGLLYGGVRWNTKDKPGTLPVNNLPAWSTYVSEIVKHCKTKVKYWEVWNEPPNGTGKDQTPADYAKLMVSTYEAAKAADPTCLVGLAAKSNHVNYLEQTIQAGAKGHFDYIVLHPYEVLNGIADDVGTEAVFMHIVPTVRKMLATQDPAKANVPIIFTELGCEAKKGLDVQAHVLVKAYAMGIAQGVACIQWFEGMDGDSGPMGMLKRDSTPRPVYTAMEQMIRHLGQHPSYLGWVQLSAKTCGFVFQGAKGTVLAIWTPRRATALVKFEQTVQIVNPLTGDSINADGYHLTTAPVLVLGVPATILAQAQANKNKPFLWGGDYTNANSVSVTMGEKNVEMGLHTMSETPWPKQSSLMAARRARAACPAATCL